MIALALLIPAILGYLTILLVGKDRQTSSWEVAAYAFPVGMGLVTYQMFILGMLRVPLRLPYVLVPVLAEIGIMAFCLRNGRWRRPLALDTPAAGNTGIGKGLLRTAEVASLIWIGCKLATIFTETCLRPIQAWDSWANWSARAKVFYYSHGLLLDGNATDVLGKGLIDVNSNYPLLNAMSQVWMALWLGNFDEVFVKIWAPFFLLAAALHLFLVGARELNRPLSLGIVILLLSSPLLSLHATEAYSDLLLAVYLLFALSSFYRFMRGESIHLRFTGIFCAMAMFAKDEGLFFAVPLLLSCTCFLWRSAERSSFGKQVLACWAPCLFMLPWFFCKFHYRLGMGADYVQFGLTFRPDVMIDYFKAMLNLANFNVVFIFLPFMLLLYNKSNRAVAYLTFPVAVYALFFASLYVCTTFFSQSVMFQTAVFRNTLSYYPCSYVLVILLVQDLLKSTPHCGDQEKPLF